MWLLFRAGQIYAKKSVNVYIQRISVFRLLFRANLENTVCFLGVAYPPNRQYVMTSTL